MNIERARNNCDIIYSNDMASEFLDYLILLTALCALREIPSSILLVFAFLLSKDI